MKPTDDFFARKEQSEFLTKVYDLAPAGIQEFFAEEERLLREAISGSFRILEIGCGYGRSVSAVPSQAQYTGVDIGLAYVLDGKRRYPRLNWVCADAAHLPFAPATFDAVFCIQNTLGNMPDIEADVIREAFRSCHSGGKVIVGVYSEDSFEIRRQWYGRLIQAGIFGRVWVDSESPRIARSDTGWRSRCFARSELEQLFRQNGAQAKISKIDRFSYFCKARKNN